MFGTTRGSRGAVPVRTVLKILLLDSPVYCVQTFAALSLGPPAPSAHGPHDAEKGNIDLPMGNQYGTVNAL